MKRALVVALLFWLLIMPLLGAGPCTVVSLISCDDPECATTGCAVCAGTPR
jgi:hypothetical protein